MRLAALFIGTALAASSAADILHLRDGSCHCGRLISQDNQRVVFRVQLADGTASAVRSFDAALVERVERGLTPPPSDSDAMRAARDAGAPDYEQVFREGLELLDDGDQRAALRALQLGVLRAPRAVLDAMDQQCRSTRGVGLAQLLANTRLAVAETARGGRGFRIDFATPYESGALASVLAAAQDERLGRRYAGRTVLEWTAHRDECTELRSGSRQLVADAQRAAAIIAARLRFDPTVEVQAEERARLLRLRDDLARLAAQIMALPRFTALPDDEPVPDQGQAGTK